jgi:putative ABC transport system permease protein
MSLLTIVIKNLLHRPTRSLLTVVGISVGIAAVVALTGLARGFQTSWEDAYRARGTDLIVARVTSRDPLPTPFSSKIGDTLRAIPGVTAAGGVLADLMSIEDSPTILVGGWETNTFLWKHLRLDQGRLPAAEHEKVILLGAITAEVLNKKVGDTAQIDTERFTVCGIYTSDALSENGSIVMPLGSLQDLTSRNNMVNFVNMKIDPTLGPEGVRQLRETIARTLPGFRSFDASQVSQANIAVQISKAMSLGTSLIAVAVGAVGVMNTMLMSVFERMHEIGVLLAIGWRRRRIVTMILLESVLLSLLGGVAGIAMGIASLRVLEWTPILRGRIAPDTNAVALLAALAVSVALGTLGGLYPAWVGARMSPSTGLRHE